jgi:hypothetical protein
MPYDLALETTVLSMKEWARRKSLSAMNACKLMRVSI